MTINCRTRTVSWVAVGVGFLVAAPSAAGAAADRPSQVDVTVRPMEWIPPGLVVGTTPPEGWSHLIYVSHPRVGHGDVDQTPGYAIRLTTTLTISILANVVSESPEGGAPYRLEKAALGLGKKIQGRNVIVSSSTSGARGADLDFITRQVLAEYEKALQKDALQVARTANMLIFDVRAIVLRNGEHCEMVLRHAFLAARDSGSLGTLVWLLAHGPDDSYVLADREMQFLPRNMQEDRVLTVKADKFFLGIPAQDAFALVKIPQGTAVPFTPGLKPLAAVKRFSVETVRQLEAELWKLWKK